MTTLTPEQRRAVREAGDGPVRLEDPETRTAYVVVRADVYDRLLALADEEQDRREQDAWLKLAKRARDAQARENPY